MDCAMGVKVRALREAVMRASPMNCAPEVVVRALHRLPCAPEFEVRALLKLSGSPQNELRAGS